LQTAEIRESFQKYFESKDHTRVPSSSLIPQDDPTLLFNNAGMNQFKEVFLGHKTLSFTKATSAQKCIRAGGKHNDLENVGVTARHHTFFEMMGNFSFGDYFKEEAIYYCWEYITKYLKLPPEKLYATVYQDDDDAFKLWEKIAPELKNGRIQRFGEKDNYWSMGETGPCGPSSELHFDRGENYQGTLNGDGDRFMEIWNLVFMQYNRDKDGKMTELPKPSIDTGAGLERMAMLMQKVDSNYDTDLFQPLLRSIENLSGKEYFIDQRGVSHRVVADHIRALTFALTDGGIPSNEGRGYVLRRILRRAVRHGKLLGLNEPFMYKLTSTLVDMMGAAYPEIKTQAEHVSLVIKAEEESFGKTLDRGIDLFEQVADKTIKKGGKIISGLDVFKLYDTYGFPVDLTEVMAREKGLSLDLEGFNLSLERQRAQSKAHTNFGPAFTGTSNGLKHQITKFTGYDDKFEISTRIVYAEPIHGKGMGVVLDKTPFYAESGGQIFDTGIIQGDDFELEIEDVKKVGDSVFHIVKNINVDIEMLMQKEVTAIVDSTRQKSIQRNHTATHLLHKALREVLGEHVEQRGSLVAPDRLRFDYSHFQAMTAGEWETIEKKVNDQILKNTPVVHKEYSFDEAKKKGAMALFGEKYGDKVRMVSVGDYSKELCGGTHVQATGEIGPFVIISEGAIAAGIRRIEALTGEGAWEFINRNRITVEQSKNILKVEPEKLVARLETLFAENKKLKKEVEKKKSQGAAANISELFEKADEVAGTKLVIATFESKDELNNFADFAQSFKKAAVGVFFSDKNQYGVIASNAAIKKGLSARNIINHLNKELDGRGGGREYFTQGGSSQKLEKEQLTKLVSDFINKETD